MTANSNLFIRCLLSSAVYQSLVHSSNSVFSAGYHDIREVDKCLISCGKVGAMWRKVKQDKERVKDWGVLCRVFREIEGVTFDHKSEWRRSFEDLREIFFLFFFFLALDSMAMFFEHHWFSHYLLEKRKELGSRILLLGHRDVASY